MIAAKLLPKRPRPPLPAALRVVLDFLSALRRRPRPPVGFVARMRRLAKDQQDDARQYWQRCRAAATWQEIFFPRDQYGDFMPEAFDRTPMPRVVNTSPARSAGFQVRTSGRARP